MRKSLMKSGVFVGALVALLAPATAQADVPLTVKVEPGVAVPLTSPQSDRFDPGVAGAVKPLFGLTPWLGLGPTVSALVLPSRLAGIDAGTAYGIGAAVDVHRPHDNPGKGLKAISPWIGAEAQYVRTDGLNRPAFSVAAGAAVPTSESRSLWVGPFVRYLDVVQSLADRPGFDNSDAKVLIAGISFELGAPAKKEAAPAQPKAEPKKEPPPKAEPAPQPEPEPAALQLTLNGTVQFPFDSAVPLPESDKLLKETLRLLLEHTDQHITLEGHASSEGPVVYNEKLSVRRAQAVADYLVKNGVAADRLTVKGFGPHVPVADNATEAGRAKNRRVEYTFTVTITQKKEGAQ